LALTGNLTVGTATAGTNAFVVVGNTALTGNTALMGNVGIGKTTPQYALDVSGSMAIGGKSVTGTTFTTSSFTAGTTLGSSPLSISMYQQYALAATSNGIYYSSNYGQTWTQSASYTTMVSRGVGLASNGNAVASAHSTLTGLYYSTNNGVTWAQSNITTGSWYDVAISKTGTYAIAGSNGTSGIYYSSNGGQTWTQSNINSGNVGGLAMSSTGQYAIASSNGTSGFWYSSNYGQTWTSSNISSGSGNKPAMSDNGQYCIMPTDGAPLSYMYYSSNYGQYWSIAAIPSGAATGRTSAIDSTGKYCIAAQTGTSVSSILLSTNYGQNWVYNYSGSTVVTTYSVAMTQDGTRMIIGAGATGATYYATNTITTSTSTSSSVSLSYDASNINQLDVSGSLALVNSNASTMIVTPVSSAATLYTWNNNNVTWSTSQSSFIAGTATGNYAFTNQTAGTTNNWTPSGAVYTGTGGLYNGASNYPTVIQGVSTIYGEWLQIQSSVPLIMKNYYFMSAGGNAVFQGRLPKSYYICGSNDNGSNWYPIQYVTFTSIPVSSSSATTTQSTAVYTINNTPTGSAQTQNASTSVYYYSTSLNTYTSFRLVVTSAIYTSSLSSQTFTGEGYLSLFWNPTFAPASSAVSLALDNAVPNQLNIGGSLGIAGGLSLGGTVYVTGTNNAANPAPDGIGVVNMNTYFPTVVMPQGTLFLVRLSSSYVTGLSGNQTHINFVANVAGAGWSGFGLVQHFANTDYLYFGDMVPFYNQGGAGPIQFGVNIRYFSASLSAGAWPAGSISLSVYKIF